MKLNAWSCASAMRWPGGGNHRAAGSRPAAAARRGPGWRRGRGRISARSARRSISAGSAACSLGLHQAEMALRQRDRGVALDAAEDGQADARASRSAMPSRCRSLPTRLSTTPAMRTAGSCRCEAAGDGGRTLRLAGDVEHQQDRQVDSARRGRRRRRCGPLGASTPSNRPIADSISSRSASRRRATAESS